MGTSLLYLGKIVQFLLWVLDLCFEAKMAAFSLDILKDLLSVRSL